MTVGPVSPATAPLHVMQLASRHADWAATRQAVIAGNIANADTPRYRARDVEPFHFEERATRLQVVATDPKHLTIAPTELYAAEVEEAEAWDMSHSANTVSLDEELMKADQTGRAHKLSLSIMGSFHRMIMTSVTAR